MKDETKKEYIRLAEHFIKTVHEKHESSRVSPSVYIDELEQRAYSTTPAYWRRLRNAMNTYALENLSGKYKYVYKTLENPVTKNGLDNIPKEVKAHISKRRKANSMSNDEYLKIYENTRDEATKSVMNIMKITGCRPAEIPSINIVDGVVLIESVKKDEADTRGLDRKIRVGDAVAMDVLTSSIENFRAEAQAKNQSEEKLVKLVQDRFKYAAKRAYPRRKGICLYTLRHQRGAELKSSGMDRREVAYLMGHRVTSSVDVYGSSASKSSKGGGVALSVANREDLSVVRENHKNPNTDITRAKTATKSKTKGASFDY